MGIVAKRLRVCRFLLMSVTQLATGESQSLCRVTKLIQRCKLQRLADVARVGDGGERGGVDPLIAGGAPGMGAKELEGDAAIRHGMAERPDGGGTAYGERLAVEERGIAVREVEHRR